MSLLLWLDFPSARIIQNFPFLKCIVCMLWQRNYGVNMILLPETVFASSVVGGDGYVNAL